MASRFNVQHALEEMRAEHREDMQYVREASQSLATTVDEGFKACTKALADHALEDTKAFSSIDNRLVIIENGRRLTRWLAGALVVALITAGIDFVFSHVK